MFKTINGERVEIPEDLIREIYESSIETPEGASCEELFDELSERLDISVDEEQAAAMWKARFVYQLMSHVGGRNEDKQFFARSATDDGSPRRTSWKVMSSDELKDIKAGFVKKRDRLNLCIGALSALIMTKPLFPEREFGVVKRAPQVEERQSASL